MIAIVSPTQKEGGGAETVLGHLLRGWVFPRNAILVMSPVGSRISRVAEELDFPRLTLNTNRDALLSNFAAVRSCRAQMSKCRIVHAWTARAFELGWWLGAQLGARVCGTLHDHPNASFHGRIRRRMMRFFANRLDKVVCVSNAVREACMEAGYRCVMGVIHNGLVANNAIIRRRSPQARVGFAGMHASFKGYRVVESWVRNTTDQDVRWHLYGHIASDLKESAQRLVDDFPQRVELHGRQTPEAIFSGIDILVHVSTEFDSLPTVLIEAARAQVPVVASCLGGAPEIVDHGVTGFIFDPQSPEEGLSRLRQLIDDEKLRQRMGSAARERYLSHFGVGRMVAEYARLWKHLSFESECGLVGPGSASEHGQVSSNRFRG